MNLFLRALRTGNVLLMDGAMGTELARLHESPELFETDTGPMTEPERVAFVHSQYTTFKANVILTNTFQVNPLILEQRSAGGLHHALWRSAIDAARCAAPPPLFILGDVGPMKGCTPEIASAILKECKGLAGVMLETWSSIADLKMFAKVHKPSMPPLLVSFTYQRNRKSGWVTFEEARPEACAKAAQRCGAVAIGVNCGRGLTMKNMREIVRRYHDACDLPIFVRPNAGTPTKDGAGWEYPHSADEMADDLMPILEEGIAMVGGCCGTTPDHIWRFGLAIDAWNARRQMN